MFELPCSLFFTREMELALIGLQNAGKTSLVTVLTSGQFQEDMIPTVGFNMRKVTKGGVTLKCWDLGGQVREALLVCLHDSRSTRPIIVALSQHHPHTQTRFRSMWERYCRGVQAIVYVVDSADLDSLDAAKEELHALLVKPSLVGGQALPTAVVTCS